MRYSKGISLVGALVVALGAALPVSAQEGPLDVDEAVRIALRQNPSYKQAEASVGIASGSRLDQLAGLLPNFSGSYSYTDDHSTSLLEDLVTQEIINAQDGGGRVLRRSDLEFDTDTQRDAWSVGVRADFSLSRWYNFRSAQADYQGAKWGREAAAQDLAFNVRQQFYLVLRAQDLLQVQEEDLRLARDEERRINSMFDLGSVARVDVLKAQVRVSDAEVALIRQQNTVEIERARLATLLGLSPDTRLNLVGDLESAMSAIDSSAAVDESLGRPDLKQAQESLRSAGNLYKAAALSRLPSLFASLDYSDSKGSRVADEFDRSFFPSSSPDSLLVTYSAVPQDSDFQGDGLTFRIGASVNLDAFLNMGQHRRSHSARLRAEFALEDLELEVKREIEEAILNYRASAKAIDAAQRGVDSAQEDLRLSEERYQQGLGTVLELLESQVALTRARNNLVNALTALKISEAALDKARGAPITY